MVPCCFQVNSELKLLLSAFTHKKVILWSYEEKISNDFHQAALLYYS